jgi:thiol-disulfide isomerase/thioredoxin
MKKIFLTTLVLASLAACKKETKTEDSKAEETNSATVSEPEKSTETTSLKEFSPEKTAELLTAKSNDTLYITNFFATWCGPCMREIPHFKKKMQEMKDKPVKFTFVSVDDKEDWNDSVKNFAEENGLQINFVLLNMKTLSPDFFAQNFKEWKGDLIPCTVMKKGNKMEEISGGMSKEELDEKINLFKQ